MSQVFKLPQAVDQRNSAVRQQLLAYYSTLKKFVADPHNEELKQMHRVAKDLIINS